MGESEELDEYSPRKRVQVEQMTENGPIHSRSTNKRRWLLACGVILPVSCVLVIVLVLVGGWLLIRATRSSLKVDLDYPSEVRLGDTVEVLATLQNIQDRVQRVTAVTFDSSMELNFADGFEFVEAIPAVIYHEDVLKQHYYFFDITLEPGQSQSVRLKFRALQSGVFEGLVFVDVATDTNKLGLHTPAVPISISVSP